MPILSEPSKNRIFMDVNATIKPVFVNAVREQK